MRARRPERGLPLSVRIENSSSPEPTSGCWLWTAAVDRYGYGKITVNYVVRPAHRVSAEVAGLPVAKGLSVCHRCDNPSCVNPAHLFVGTNADNMRDRNRKMRFRRTLAPSDLPEIRRLLSLGVKQGEIGHRFGVGAQAISKINCGRRWVAA